MIQTQSQSQDDKTLISSTDSEKRYPVKLVNHPNIYARYLVDVDGSILKDKNQHRVLNVFREEMNDAIEDGRLRVIRNSTMKNICYRYFVTSNKQHERFLEDVENGSLLPGLKYHVYCDEDVDQSSQEYRKLFTVHDN